MSTPARLDELVQKYLDGACSEPELAELQRAMAADPAAADAFARATRLNANVSKIIRGEKGIRASAAKILEIDRRRAAPLRSSWRWRIAAAVLLLALLGGSVALLQRNGPPEGKAAQQIVLSGEVLINNRAVTVVPPGGLIRIAGSEPGVVKLVDGSQAEFAPQSEALLYGRFDGVRETILLNRGSGKFTVEKSGGTFVVNTPAGKVTAIGTKFDVELRPGPIERDNMLNRKAALILAVAVIAGNVRVEWSGNNFELAAGQNRVFAEETPQPARTAITPPPSSAPVEARTPPPVPPLPELSVQPTPPPPARVRPTLSVAPAVANAGTLKGIVKYDGEAPELKMIDLPAKEHTACNCNKVADESLVVDKTTKGLKWAVIRIMDAKADALPKTDAAYQLNQKGCTFSPHILVVPPGADIAILNPDAILHNIHTTPFDSNDPGQNTATQTQLTYKGKWLAEPDLIEIKCDIHSWMKGFILCHDPRYCAISEADGSFEIANLPAGKYKLNVWHEKFGNYLKKETIDIEIKSGAITDLGDLKFSPQK